MTDDPRDILKAAGVDIPTSLKAWMTDEALDHDPEHPYARAAGDWVLESADKVVLDLVRLVADGAEIRWKFQYMHDHYDDGPGMINDLDYLWEQHLKDR
jgi:hypothetical protein